MILLLDTCTVFWLGSAPEKLSNQVQDIDVLPLQHIRWFCADALQRNLRIVIPDVPCRA